jgi:hypothetical protein
VLAAIEWKMLMDALFESEAQIPETKWLSVKYEDLVASPESGLQRILEFAALPDRDAFWTQVRRNPLTSGRVDAYRRDLRPEDVAAMDDVLKQHLATLGYQPAGSPPP